MIKKFLQIASKILLAYIVVVLVATVSLVGTVVFDAIYAQIRIVMPSLRVIEKGNWDVLIGVAGWLLCVILFVFSESRWRFVHRLSRFIDSKFSEI